MDDKITPHEGAKRLYEHLKSEKLKLLNSSPLNNIRLELIENAGHQIMEEKPHILIEMILKMVSSILVDKE